MIKHVVAIILLAATAHVSQAQNLEDFNTKRFNTTRKGMLVLGGWASANLIASSLLKQNATGSDRYFYDMNMYWNAVNLLIAGVGYMSVRHENPSEYNLSQSVIQQHQTEKILLFNSGLDAAYVMTGLFLREKGLRESSDKWEGYGNSLILQGSFLAVFDMLFYMSHRKNAKQLNQLMQSITLGPAGVGLKIKL